MTPAPNLFCIIIITRSWEHCKQFLGQGLRTTSASHMNILNLALCFAQRNSVRRRGDVEGLGRSRLEATCFPRKIMLVCISLLLSSWACCPCPGWTRQPPCCTEGRCSRHTLLSLCSKPDLCFLNEGAYDVFCLFLLSLLGRCQAMNHSWKGGISWLAVWAPERGTSQGLKASLCISSMFVNYWCIQFGT